MTETIDSFERIAEIESRQNDALQQLAELERRIEQVLAEYLTSESKAGRGDRAAA